MMVIINRDSLELSQDEVRIIRDITGIKNHVGRRITSRNMIMLESDDDFPIMKKLIDKKIVECFQLGTFTFTDYGLKVARKVIAG